MTRKQVALLCVIFLIATSSIPAKSAVKSDHSLIKNILLPQNQAQTLNIPIARSTKGEIQWNRTYGGPGNDRIYSVIETADGGYALAGWIFSSRAGKDAWLVKTNNIGIEQWNQTYGGSGGDHTFSVIQTIDGGFVLAGYTSSYGAGNLDGWLVKTTSNGAAEWNQTYGGPGDDWVATAIQTTDGGFAIAGSTESYGAGSWDFWLVKTNADGRPQWNRTYGGPKKEILRSGIQTADGGFALTGETSSIGTNRIGWVVKIDANGKIQWTQTYDKFAKDWATSIIQTTDGGLAFTGVTDLTGAIRFDIMPGDPGEWEVWLVKMNAYGELQWNQTYNHRSWDVVSEVIQTTDGGFALAGGKETSDNGWLVKTDEYGVLQWNQTYEDINIQAMCQARDGGLVFVGYTHYYETRGVEARLLKTVPLENTFFNRFVYGLSVVMVLTILVALGIRRKRK